MTQPSGPQRESISLDRAVELTQRHLRLDAAFIAELTDGGEIYGAVSEDTGAFSLAASDDTVHDSDFCRALLAGQIPKRVCDACGDERLARLAARLKAPVGAFIGVPLRLPDGSVFGALCGLSHTPRPELDERDERFAAMLADVLADELDARREQRQTLIGITHLIENQDLRVAFQPIIDLQSQRCIGVEALARFPDPFVRPDWTLAAAQKFGLRLELERLLVREAWKILPSLGPGQFLAMNVSPDGLVELARRANLRDDLPLTQLVIEVTEHSVVDRYEPLLDQLAPTETLRQHIAVCRDTAASVSIPA